jgi:hypothetical protein
MKLPNLAQPISRRLSAAKIITAKGIVANFLDGDCGPCFTKCVKGSHLPRLAFARCVAVCAPYCIHTSRDVLGRLFDKLV